MGNIVTASFHPLSAANTPHILSLSLPTNSQRILSLFLFLSRVYQISPQSSPFGEFSSYLFIESPSSWAPASMELRRVCESQETKDNESAADLDRKGSEVESSGNVIGTGRTVSFGS